MKKILCLHGKHQNREIFRTKLGRLPQKLKQYANLTIIDAPFEMTNLTDLSESTKSLDTDAQSGTVLRYWFDRNEEGQINFEEIDQSLKYLQDKWMEEGPFDGVFGFSMGGILATLMATKEHIAQFPNLKFVICVGTPDLPEIFDSKEISPEIKSLHVVGETDTHIPKEKSEQLLNRYTDGIIKKHPQGHCIPSKAENMLWFQDFVKAQTE